MEFINETRCNERTVLAMNRASIRATHWWSSLLLRLLGGACGVFLLRTAARLGFPSLGGISAGLMGGGLWLWVLFLNHIRAWIVIRLVLKGEQLHRAAFDEEGCTIRSGGDEVRLSYDQVAAFYEDQRYFFLMLNRHQGYALEKQGFRSGQPDAFRAFLERKADCRAQRV